MTRLKILQGDCLDEMDFMNSESVQCVVTSPPYFGLRDYGVEGQIGLEQTPEQYVQKMVEVFREVRRILKPDGTLWLNLGDSYMSRQFGWGRTNGRAWASVHKHVGDERSAGQRVGHPMEGSNAMSKATGIKNKELIGIPWMVAFALRADGWHLRQDIIWHKPNPMPESVRDRCTKAHEYIFLLTKSERYYYDADAVREPYAEGSYSADAIAKAGKAGGVRPSGNNFNKQARHENGESTPATRAERAALLNPMGRNRRSVWTVTTKPFKGAHFATYPADLIEPCIKAGSRPGDVVFDPFGGSGTTAAVALRHGRRAITCELNPEYVKLIQQRTSAAIAECDEEL